MAQQDTFGKVLAVLFTVIGLALVWLSIVTSLPSQLDLAAANAPSTDQITSTDRKSATAGPMTADRQPEPALDLSIPGRSSSLPFHGSDAVENRTADQKSAYASGSIPTDPRVSQITKLKCAAEIEQLCPDSTDGTSRTRCLERRAKKLDSSCQAQLQERFVKWKDERTRMFAACDMDIKRFCRLVRPGEGRVLQCLQDHTQDVSDRCYGTLPKGTLLFTQ
ncbi:putative Exported protein [Nitrospira sp. KM1]|uniref:cysteine rich repeat-containing protein n=1 Tax=Nitrospira sp. KM1 TaxID=1936990 RepID=UPI0013A75895|nr:cysteine rich repeat-containing protein [Nitrospira sp. KM1]BCA57012.1 putative Exported protein [Nitrospira sp. KM1]